MAEGIAETNRVMTRPQLGEPTVGLTADEQEALSHVAETTNAFAVGTFGTCFDPPSCQCPATQAGLAPVGAVGYFGIAFDRAIENVYGIHSYHINTLSVVE